jgi:excisionase family DNA binding protein
MNTGLNVREKRPFVDESEISTGVAARILKVSQDTAARLCEAGTLRARRTTLGWWRIKYDSVIEYSQQIRNSS